MEGLENIENISDCLKSNNVATLDAPSATEFVHKSSKRRCRPSQAPDASRSTPPCVTTLVDTPKVGAPPFLERFRKIIGTGILFSVVGILAYIMHKVFNYIQESLCDVRTAMNSVSKRLQLLETKNTQDNKNYKLLGNQVVVDTKPTVRFDEDITHEEASEEASEEGSDEGSDEGSE